MQYKLRRRCAVALTATVVLAAAMMGAARPAAAASPKAWANFGRVSGGATDPKCQFNNLHAWSYGCNFIGELYAGRNYVYCKVWGGRGAENDWIYNHWWLLTDLDYIYPDSGGRNPAWVSALALTGPKNAHNDTAFDETGNAIPNCDRLGPRWAG